MRSGWVKGLGVGVLSFGAAVAVVEGVAAFRVHRLRAARAYLGDRLYTEIRGQGPPVIFLAGLPAGDDHLSYPTRSAGRILAVLEAR